MLKQIDFAKLPITEIVNEIIYTAAEAGTSDIHFDPTETTIKVRFRIDGVLVDYTIIPESIRKNLVARLKIISGMDITESRLPQDGAIKTVIKNLNLDMRVSSLPTNEGEKIVIRILDYSASLSGLESLGFSQINLRKMKDLIKEPNGIILVTGATGSGKSTTVYSLLQILNTPQVNLVTVEDPVEMGIEGINQIQVNSEIGLTFASVLRSILRQDPDIIMIGEIRDDETAQIAVRASITGHLVLSTIHTNNALNTIERLTDMNVERYLLASSLNGVVSQKLARRICKHCAAKRPAINYEKKLIKINLGIDINELTYAKGCPECVGGYKGRIAIHEVLTISQEIRDAIANGIPKEKLRELVYKGDTKTLLQDGLQKVVDGSTTVEEILRLVELDDENAKILLEKELAEGNGEIPSVESVETNIASPVVAPAPTPVSEVAPAPTPAPVSEVVPSPIAEPVIPAPAITNPVIEDEAEIMEEMSLEDVPNVPTSNEAIAPVTESNVSHQDSLNNQVVNETATPIASEVVQPVQQTVQQPIQQVVNPQPVVAQTQNTNIPRPKPVFPSPKPTPPKPKPASPLNYNNTNFGNFNNNV